MSTAVWKYLRNAGKVLLSLDLKSIYELNHRLLVDAPQYLKEYDFSELGEPGPITRSLWFH